MRRMEPGAFAHPSETRRKRHSVRKHFFSTSAALLLFLFATTDFFAATAAERISSPIEKEEASQSIDERFDELTSKMNKLQEGFAVHIVRLQASVRQQHIRNSQLRGEMKKAKQIASSQEARISTLEKRLDESERDRKSLMATVNLRQKGSATVVEITFIH